ncbi:hypothetical protein LQ938_11020 [Microbacterium sp. cx-55]|uniref:hypothetical protein n=1 Tax=unclassified Microbacterium TaxID=2609290 RepID=UPI001CBBC6D4|nr:MULTISPECIES: hypothetical protein [unclassified Microbacterium]MBZ4488191.1 hypothetical protein [Microbacterium sp. cx-55]MCC4908802.1 hypothetical protein [Microbacterium sp. cx-59]UGB34402.1 hypothetical protein LQ938_11020 [Microbacterium sp. cx-55]
MSLQRMSPRVLPADGQRAPVYPNGRNPRALAWLVTAVALLPAFLAVADGRGGFRLVMGALAVTILTIGISLHRMFGAIEPRVVRVDEDAAGLRFAPPAAATLPMFAVAVALLLPGIAQLVVDTQGLPTMSGGIVSRAPYALGILGLVTLAVQLWRVRVPAGLELTTERLRGIRGSAGVDWRWEDLADVSVAAGPVAKLSLVPRGGAGRPVLAPMLALGSDPNEVAAIVRFYLERPAERVALAEGGVAAVRRVEDALRARR